MRINTAVLALLATTAAAVPMSTVDTATTALGTATAPGSTHTLVPVFNPRRPGEFTPCVMPHGCRDNSKHDALAAGPPPKAPMPMGTTSISGTVSVPTKTAGHSDRVSWPFPWPPRQTRSAAA